MKSGYNGQDAAVLSTPPRPNNADGGRAAVPTYKPIPILTPDELARFHSRIEKREGGCWQWTGFRDRHGYGSFYVRRGIHRGMLLVHRISYSQAHGNIPQDLSIDHLCLNTSCCNPSHLEAVPIAVNMSRSHVHSPRKWKLKTHCPRGHEYTERNTYRWKGGNKRQCLACYRVRYHQRRAQANAEPSQS
jgi:hypothetical protein